MITKVCSKCHKEKPYDQFIKKTISKDGLGSYCKECNKVAVNKHYQEHKQEYIKRAKLQIKKATEWLREYKTGKTCSDCGVIYPPEVFDFDHKDPGNKRNTLSRLTSMGSINSLKKEIEKCDLVCANCHRIRHIKRPIRQVV